MRIGKKWIRRIASFQVQKYLLAIRKRGRTQFHFTFAVYLVSISFCFVVSFLPTTSHSIPTSSFFFCIIQSNQRAIRA